MRHRLQDDGTFTIDRANSPGPGREKVPAEAAVTSKVQPKVKLKGAEIMCESLLREGVDVIFGYPGGAILPFYDALWSYPQLRHILVRHEQSSAHAADAYARVTGRPGVCVATSGPGATNLVTGIMGAKSDSVPMIAITGPGRQAGDGHGGVPGMRHLLHRRRLHQEDLPGHVAQRPGDYIPGGLLHSA